MNRRAAWWTAVAVVAAAAAGTLGWSLFAVARHYGMPELVAAATVAVFDGCALACLKLAADASRAGRSAIGPRLATLAMAAASGYLNNWHSELIRGGLAASLLFIAPTAALLFLSDLSWSAARAEARTGRGETPMRLPVLGLAWLIAPKGSAAAVKKRAADHLHALNEPPRKRSAHDVLAAQFAGMDPADAIHIARASHAHLGPSDLAELLRMYGVTVDAMDVALVLGQVPPRIRIDRADDADEAHHDAPQVEPPTEPGAISQAKGFKAKAILDAASTLRPGADAETIAKAAARLHGVHIDPAYVRTVLSREARKPKPPTPPERMDGYL